MLIKYKFECNGVSITPHYTDALTKSTDKASGQQFFRTTLSGNIKLLGSDFDWVMAQPFDTEYVITLYRSLDMGLTWDLYVTGSFFRTDCDVDEETKRLTVQVNATDSYTKIISGLDTEYDLIKRGIAKTPITMYRRPMLQMYIPGASAVSNYINGSTWEQDVKEEITDVNALTDTYHFAFANHTFFNDITAVGTVTPSDVAGSYTAQATPEHAVCLANGYSLSTEGMGAKYIVPSHILTYEDLGSIWLDGSNRPWVLSSTSGSPKFVAFFHTYTMKGTRLIHVRGAVNSSDIDLQAAPTAAPITYISRLNDAQGNLLFYTYQDLPSTTAGQLYFCPYNGTGSIVGTRAVLDVYMRYLLDVESHPVSGATLPIPTSDIVENDRNYSRVVPHAEGLFYLSSNTSVEPTPYRLLPDGVLYYAPPDNSGRYLPVAVNYWVKTSMWLDVMSISSYYEEAGRKAFALADTVLLSNVVSNLLSDLDNSITHESTTVYSELLYGTVSPLGAKANKLMITPKSNIITSIYNEPAKKAPVKLSDIFNMLRDCFDAYWFVDANNRLRIEHISWFKNGGSYGSTPVVAHDLTTLRDSKNHKPFAFGASKYNFEKISMPASYKFAWMDDVTSLFNGSPITMKSGYVQKDKVENIDVSMFTSDIDYIMLNPSAISKDGFALVAAVPRPTAVTTTFTQGRIVNSTDGTLFTATASAASDYVLCSGASTITLNMPRNTTTSAAGVAFYNAAKVFISGISRPVGVIGSVHVTYAVPSGAAYFRTTYWNTANSAIYGAFYGNVYFNGDYQTSFELMYLPGSSVAQVQAQNALLSFTYLHPHYKMHNLPCKNVTINGNGETALGVSRNKVQKVSFPCSDDVSTNALIKTSIGNGSIEKISVNLSSLLTSIELRYDTEQ